MAAMRSWCIIETARGDWGGLAPVRVHDAAAAVSVHRGAVCVLKGNMIRAACGISVRYLRGSSYSDDVDEYRLFARDVMYLSYPRRISRNCSPEARHGEVGTRS